MLRPDLWDYSDANIVVKGNITLTETNGRGIIDIRNSFQHLKTMHHAYQRSIMY